MNAPHIVIEPLLQCGKQYWQVCMGRRRLVFHEEQAARAFAAQLHMRRLWLQQNANPDDEIATPETHHES